MNVTMLSSPEYRVLRALLRAGLWEKEVELSDVFPATSECWHRVFRLARQQTVTSLVYRGLTSLPERFFPADPLLCRWTAEADRIERANRRMNAVLADLYAFFGAHGLRPVLLKGQGIASLYANPWLREAGDIDLYFRRPEERTESLRLIRAQGTEFRRQPDGSVSYLWQGIEVEHHPALFDLHAPRVRRSLHTLEWTYGFAEQTLTADGSLRADVPAPVLNLLLLNTHILKHAIGRGIGLRQLCDMARAYHVLCGQRNCHELKKIYSDMGIRRWSRLLHAFLTDELGLSQDSLPYWELRTSARDLSSIVYAGGNFGRCDTHGTTVSQSPSAHKLHTAGAFLRNLRFSCRYAPQETFWTATSLFKGQFTC